MIVKTFFTKYISTRGYWILTAAVLLFAEILIGRYLHDAIIRPYGGDVLVIPLLAALWRTVFPERPRHIGLYMISAGFAAEILQAFGLCRRLGIENTIWAVILGTGFSHIDLLCYIAGGVSFDIAERNIGIHGKK